MPYVLQLMLPFLSFAWITTSHVYCISAGIYYILWEVWLFELFQFCSHWIRRLETILHHWNWEQKPQNLPKTLLKLRCHLLRSLLCLHFYSMNYTFYCIIFWTIIDLLQFSFHFNCWDFVSILYMFILFYLLVYFLFKCILNMLTNVCSALEYGLTGIILILH